jgi:hypothetical protein
MLRRSFVTTLCLASMLAAGAWRTASADDREMVLVDGKLTLTAPESWTKKNPKVRIIDFEYAIAPEGDDEAPGRMTIMGAGGSIDDNINRWIGQFEQPDGSSSKEKTKREETTVAGQKVHMVDISGTYKDQPGPFAPAVKREDYRMLAAIVSTESNGQYFVKFYGPKNTVAKNEEAFKKMIAGLKVK